MRYIVGTSLPSLKTAWPSVRQLWRIPYLTLHDACRLMFLTFDLFSSKLINKLYIQHGLQSGQLWSLVSIVLFLSYRHAQDTSPLVRSW